MKKQDNTYRSKIFDNGLEFRNKTFDLFIDESDQKQYGNQTISFIDCIFKLPFIIRRSNIKEISFINCKFEREVFLVECKIGIIGFTNCLFLDSLQLTANNCTNLTVLRKIKTAKLIIEGSYNALQIVSSKIDDIQIKSINSEPLLKGSKIEFLIENEINKLNIEPYNTFSEIIFRGSKYNDILFQGSFNGRILFEYNVECKNLFFESSTFYQRIDFEKGYFENISFYRSIFNGLIFLSDFDSQDKHFTRYLNIKMLSLHSCIFNKDFNIWLSKIEDISLSNNIFNQLFQFNNYNNNKNTNDRIVMLRLDGVNRGTIIIENIYIDISISGINFSDIFIKDSSVYTITLWELDNKGSITLNNVDSGNFFSINDSVTGRLNFINTNINNFNEIVIANSNIEEINLNQYPNKVLSYSSNPMIG